ncbi:hypothetical protein IGI96_000934 [Enterococcus sp. DIV0421]
MTGSKRNKQLADKDRQRKRYKLQRIVELAERPDFDFNHAVQEEWAQLREELYLVSDPDKRLIEVLYNDEVIFTGVKKEIEKKCLKSRSAINTLLRTGKLDKQKRM